MDENNSVKLNGKFVYILFRSEESLYTVGKFRINDERERVITVTGIMDDVRTDILLEPSVILATAYCIALHLCRALHSVFCEVVVILRIEILTQRDTAAAAMGDFTVLDDPPLTPVRADHTILECRRRRPCGSCLVHGKSGKSDISDTGLTREEAVSSDVDLDLGLIRIFALEVGIDYGLSVFLLTVPLTCGVFRFPGSGILLAL